MNYSAYCNLACNFHFILENEEVQKRLHLNEEFYDYLQQTDLMSVFYCSLFSNAKMEDLNTDMLKKCILQYAILLAEIIFLKDVLPEMEPIILG